jgi:NADH:quinone reductase (non-electrogenic)
LDHVLNGFAPESQASAIDTLQERGVEVRVGQAVDRAGPGRVHLSNGDVISTATLVWAAGIEPTPLVAEAGLERGQGGRVVVEGDLRLADHPDVFVIGDLSLAHDRHRQPYPQMASVALQQGHHAGRQIGRLVAGRRTRSFRYIAYGSMATIGRNAAVAELAFGIKLRGRPGWWAWLATHLVRLMGFRNRISVFVNWAWSYLTYDRGARLIVTPGSRASRQVPASDTDTRPRP